MWNLSLKLWVSQHLVPLQHSPEHCRFLSNPLNWRPLVYLQMLWLMTLVSLGWQPDVSGTACSPSLVHAPVGASVHLGATGGTVLTSLQAPASSPDWQIGTSWGQERKEGRQLGGGRTGGRFALLAWLFPSLGGSSRCQLQPAFALPLSLSFSTWVNSPYFTDSTCPSSLFPVLSSPTSLIIES